MRHADNVGRNIIALQHPKETLGEFVARCDSLCEYNELPEPPQAGVVADAFRCATCSDTGTVHALEGARWVPYDCQDCPPLEDQP